MKTLETILNEVPTTILEELGRDGIEAIYNFYKDEAAFDEIEPDMFEGWRKYYSLEECVEKQGLTDCHTWEDVTEYFPVFNPLEDGGILVAAY